jgi:WhiB family redox-sensing transcriptional regulator
VSWLANKFFGTHTETSDWLILCDELDKHGWDVPCVSAPDLFFPDKQDYSPNATRGELALANMAKDACLDCPVMLLCRDFAVLHKKQYGIWGGTNLNERKAIWKAQGRANKPVGGRGKAAREANDGDS